MVMFTHNSPGLQKLKHQIAEALVLLLEDNGLHVLNGLTEAVALLQAQGYTVLPPSAEDVPIVSTEPGIPRE